MCQKPRITFYTDDERLEYKDRWHFAGTLEDYIKDGGKKQEAGRRRYIHNAIKEGRAVLVPCKKCVECRLAYRSNWAARMELEALYHKNALFTTMTYTPENLPIHNVQTDEYYRGAYGLEGERPTLRKKDLQDFMDRLAKDQKINFGLNETMMYFNCGEYGTKTARPHYHAIIYDLTIPDLKPNFVKGGVQHYKSEYFAKKWKWGIIDICEADWAAMSYVAGYVMKKVKQKDEDYKAVGIEPEFRCMSKGIGKRYYQDHIDMYRNDSIILKHGKEIKPPAYFDALYDVDNGAEKYKTYDVDKKTGEIECEHRHTAHSEALKAIKNQRRLHADANFISEFHRQNLNLEEYLKAKSETKEARAKQTGAIRERDFDII